MKIWFSLLMLILGLVLGSFYACIGFRIPNNISILKPGSHCDHCKKKLKWYMNIPVVSFVLLKGRCAYCNERIDVSNLYVEMFTGWTFMMSYLYFGWSMELIIALTLISALSVTAVSDFKYYYVSDRVLFISLAIILGTYIYFLKFNEYEVYLIGMVVMFTIMLLVKLIGDKIAKRECLGGGDVKLMLLVGLSLGVINGLVALFLASVLALIATLVLREKYNEGLIPFAPFILLGTTMVYILNFANLIPFV